VRRLEDEVFEPGGGVGRPVTLAVVLKGAIITTVVGVAAAAPGVSLAANPPGPGTSSGGLSAVWQYVEVVPTSSGPRAESGGTKATATLPRSVDRTLRRSSQPIDHILRNVGTLRSYGAMPESARAASAHATLPRSTLAQTSAAAPTILTTRLLVLIGVLAGSLVLAIAYRFVARAPRRPRTA
jgi:hypothetical protein